MKKQCKYLRYYYRLLCTYVFLLSLPFVPIGCKKLTTDLANDRIISDAKDTGSGEVIDSSNNIATAEGSIFISDSSEDFPPMSEASVNETTLCNNKQCICNNRLDDDGDGLVDGFDPECTGPFDNDESTFATGTPGANKDTCQDCFFDNNSGHGDDGCQYHKDCLVGMAPSKESASECATCELSSECIDTCLPRTPNGCDCFGCCNVRNKDGFQITILLDERCSLDTIEDPSICPRCVQNPYCVNSCGMCELCPGKTIRDLPDICKSNPNESTTVHSCDSGEMVCSETIVCPTGYYCHQGCCLIVLG